MNKKLNILKVIDQYGWAYHFIHQEQIKHSVHNIDCIKVEDLLKNPEKTEKYDIVYFHSPDMISETNTLIREILKVKKNQKIIGAYGGESIYRYNQADLIVSISFNYLTTLYKWYSNKTCLFMPEGADTDFFVPKIINNKNMIVGWVGRPCAVKRPHLLDKLNYQVKRKSDWGTNFFIKDRTLNSMKEFYNEIDVLILTSSSECMPRVVLEAMSCGLPVISTCVGSLPILLEKEWLISSVPEIETIKQMNSKLELLNRYPVLRREVGRRNRRFIDNYLSWYKIQPLWDKMFTYLYYNCFKELCELNNKIIKRFQYKIDNSSQFLLKYKPKTIPIAPVKTKPIIIKPPVKVVDIYGAFEILFRSNIPFVLIKDTCRDAVCKNVLNAKSSTISIAVESQNKLQLFQDYLVDKKELQDIKINIEIARFPKIKPVEINGFTASVPLPVVGYLRNLYGAEWDKYEL